MIYLDSAATTLQKPGSVVVAVKRGIREMASPGRGGHHPAVLAEKTVFTCRQAAADFFEVENPERVVFTFNATHALNIAIKSLVRPGDHVLLSGYEHNAVTRPLASIPNITQSIVDAVCFQPESFLEGFKKLLEKKIDVAICTHVSNVYGYILPMDEIAFLCRQKGVPLIVDASQSAGSLPVSLRKWGAAFVAMPGHKGLYGPQGTGILLCGKEANPLMEGGTGSESVRQKMPDFLPDRLEAGTHNVPGIAGLLEGIRFLRKKGLENVLRHEQKLIAQASEGLSAISGVEVYGGRNIQCQSGVCSFTVAGADCEEIGEKLGERGISVRAGLHCAPLAHRTGGSMEKGTVRISVSAFNTEGEIRCFLANMREIVKWGKCNEKMRS